MKKPPILKTLAIALTLGIGALAASHGALAQEAWPSKPVKIVAPVAPGGGVDLVARTIPDRLTKPFRQDFIGENPCRGAAVNPTQNRTPPGETSFSSFPALVGGSLDTTSASSAVLPRGRLPASRPPAPLAGGRVRGGVAAGGGAGVRCAPADAPLSRWARDRARRPCESSATGGDEVLWFRSHRHGGGSPLGHPRPIGRHTGGRRLPTPRAPRRAAPPPTMPRSAPSSSSAPTRRSS